MKIPEFKSKRDAEAFGLVHYRDRESITGLRSAYLDNPKNTNLSKYIFHAWKISEGKRNVTKN